MHCVRVTSIKGGGGYSPLQILVEIPLISLVALSHPSSILWTFLCPNEFRSILNVEKSSDGLPLNDGLKPSSTYVPGLCVFGLFGRP